MNQVRPTERDMAFRSELLTLWNKYAGDLPAEKMLALSAYTVGQMIAMQDQRKFTSATIMELVSENIEAGNKNALDNLMDSKGAA